MSCSSCQDLNVQFRIRNPGELGQAMRIVRCNIEDGTLEQLVGDSFHSQRPFMSLTEGGPWDDHIFYEFQCRLCNARFSLSVETHHGAGGAWRLISSET
jgi:hypothetical protein